MIRNKRKQKQTGLESQNAARETGEIKDTVVDTEILSEHLK